MTTHIAVAMSCEARPLLDAFGLRRDPAATAYPVFASVGIALVVTGVGTVASAGGVGYLAGRTGATRADP
ncbi:MAG: hypothetical protein VYE73_15535, partial [Acidobacteriota bacterium]|nr:hypothetical protein [Acidobacteriota bacterium]